MSKPFLIADPDVPLNPEPISRDWVLSGAPEGASKVLARSGDSTLALIVWECTAGRFEWHYTRDEVAFVISGEALLTNEDGKERRFAAGDVVFFPAGSVCTWHVKDRIRKVAILRETLWSPLGIAIKFWNRIKRMVGWQIVKLRPKHQR